MLLVYQWWRKLKLKLTGNTKMITYIKGNLLDPKWEFNVIVHGANCFHTMSSGIAYQIAKKYPEALEADKLTKHGDREKLGSISVAATGKDSSDSPLVVNAYTQFTFGREEGMTYVSYEAIKSSMEEIYNLFGKGSEYKIGMPKIGSGLGGGDWAKIEKIINDVFSDKEVFIVEYDNTAD